MFCHKCGYKLTNNNKCNNCGTIFEKFEVCGGFWGLVGEERKKTCELPEPFVVNDKEILENLAILTERVENAERRQQKSTYGLLAIVIVILIFSNVVLLSKLDELKDFNKKYFKNLEEVLVTELATEELVKAPTAITEETTTQEEPTTEVVTTEVETTESEPTPAEEETTVPTNEQVTTETITTASTTAN